MGVQTTTYAEGFRRPPTALVLVYDISHYSYLFIYHYRIVCWSCGLCLIS